jgi:putative ABC transport system substrate-binding protein
MDRRRFLLTSLAGAVAAPFAAEGQAPGKVPRIGYVFVRSASDSQSVLDAAREGLREVGYVEGRNIALEIRWAEGRYERLPALVAELVRLKVDVLVVVTIPGALAAKNATRTIPVVMLAAGDPVAAGLVSSLARPGGNLTGMSLSTKELSSKRLALLKEALPRITRVAVLTNPGNPFHAVFWNETQTAAQALGLLLQSVEVRTTDDFDDAFTAAAQGHAEALLAFDDSLTIGGRTRLVTLAAKRRLPAMYGLREFPDAGGLLSYGANVLDQYRRSAAFVDKILKGAKDRRSSLDRGGRCARAAPLGDARAGQVAPQMSARQRS